MNWNHVRPTSLLFAAVAFLGGRPAAGADGDPSFAFGFEGPAQVQGAPGEVLTFEVFATLTTTGNTSPDGALGWSLGLLISNEATILKISLKGIVVSTIFDEDADRDPETPPVHHDPYFQDLSGTFTSIANKGSWPFGAFQYMGAVSAVVLKSQEKMVLQPNGTQQIARLTIQATVPPGPECTPVNLWVHDAIYTGSSQPINNMVTFHDGLRRPELGSTTILVCPSRFRRGDSNSDGGVDISDAIGSLAFLFLGGRTPGCMAAADANDDGQVDLSDPVFTLGVLFSPEVDARFPSPGPYDCGPDPSPDSLSCLGSCS